ncbi:type II secretion system ATPase GspE [Rhodospirillaceae bacterium SYSU D60014]|uniref:type II secretion system ATPase GspE n=1 Tax=Virgifigura deserti TaxID=2268457 RepID=UPI0013C48750
MAQHNQSDGTVEAPKAGDRLCEHLLAAGLIDSQGLARVRSIRDSSPDGRNAAGAGLHVLLTRLGIVSERDMAQALSTVLGLPLARPADYADQPLLNDGISTKFLRKSGVLPLADAPDALSLAMIDPLDDFTLQAIRLAVGKPVQPVVAVPTEMEEAFQRLYGSGKTEIAEIVGEGGDSLALDEEDTEQLKDLASGAPVVRLVSLLIAKAVEAKASDIHIEPSGARLRVRYRIDGVLHDVESPPPRLSAAVVSRIKIMAKLNIAERRLPQDGRIRLVVRGIQIDLRISVLPTMHGERVVIRILDRESMPVGLIGLGFDEGTLANLESWLALPNGIILVTGPTGSGKTTTLYASLLRMNSTERNVITVEDPIEYQLDNINQVQVKSQIDLTFANILRSILRQDPDVIMIGEIRDRETAEIAVHAALTGHLVLSTLHTNTAAGAISRLLDMGIEDYLLTSALTGVMAQRLVRRLCRDCRKPYAPSPTTLDEVGVPMALRRPDLTLYEAAGCAQCNHTGYSGRTGIVELLEITDPLRRIIVERAASQALHAAAVQGGMRSMYQHGVEKVLDGVTTIQEVARVTREV